MTLEPGVQFAALKPSDKFNTALLHLRQIRLVPLVKYERWGQHWS
jgi:hypothetical protein